MRITGGSEIEPASYEGPWAIFHFFSDADNLYPSNAGYSVEWVIRTGKQPVRLPDGTPVSVRFDLDLRVPIFQKGYFTDLRCVSEIARP